MSAKRCAAVAPDGSAYVTQEHIATVPKEMMATLVAVDWVVDVALRLSQSVPTGVALWMGYATDSWQPRKYNLAHNPGGVRLAPGPTGIPRAEIEQGAVAHGAFFLQDKILQGEWVRDGGKGGGDVDLRVLGGLAHLVADVDGTLAYAWAVATFWSMIEDGLLRDPQVRNPRRVLPQALLTAGSQRAAEQRRLPDT